MKTMISILLLPFFLLGCQESETKKIVDNEDFNLKSQGVVSASNRFGWDLLETVNNEAGEGENVVVSSLSVAQAMGMTINGASGKTLDQMLDVMNFSDLAAMNSAFKNIRNALHSADPDVEMEVANSVWYEESLPANEEFRNTVKNYYDAVFEGVDFSDKEGAKHAINDWVNDKTRGKIPTIIDKISDQQYMFLVNAVYFLGQWEYQFEESNTNDADFHLSDGSLVKIPMMGQENDFPYFSDETLRAVKLSYGNGSFYMVVALPENDMTVDGLINEMDSAKWSSMLNGFREVELRLRLPRFEVECKYQLNNSLKKMGMTLPFAPYDADFSNMIDDKQVFIDKVNHKTFIRVNEEGTEAAAATSVGVAITSVQPQPLIFRADRPFFFAIAEEESGAILFSGKIENPVKE